MSDASTTGQEASAFAIGDLWSIVRMQRALVSYSVAAVFLLAVLYTLIAPRKYRSTAVVHLATSAGQEIRTERVVDTEVQRWNRSVYVRTQIDILNSSEVLTEVLRRYEEAGYEGLVGDGPGIAALRSMLVVQVRQGTELLDISVTSYDPEKSAVLAQYVAEVFKDQNLAALTDAATSARDWLDEQILAAESSIEQIGVELREYQRDNDLADAEDKSTTSQAMESLKLAYGAANTDRVIHENMVRQHEALWARGMVEQLAKEMDTPLINTLMQAYATAATEQARMHARYKEKFQERIVADAEMARIEEELKAEVLRTLQGERARLTILVEKEKRLAEEIEGGKDALLVRQGSRVGYDRKKLEFDAARDNYARLQVRRSELELQAKTQLNNVRIIEAAAPRPSPVSPLWMVNLVVGLGGGLLFGLAAAFLREWMDDSISSPLEVTTFLRAPFLGLVPKIESEKDPQKLGLYTHANPHSDVAEAMRGIRTVLELAPEGGPKRMLVTSAVQSEGKTSTTIHLGVAYANVDRKVVLVDCDLRRPRLHKVFSDDREVGVTSVLRGEKTLDEAIQTTPVPNLWFIASGRSGERPAELLSSAALTRFLADLDDRFDLVVIDSPPSAVLSDARVLSKHVDGVVLVVRENAASRALIRDAIVGLEQVGARLYGVALNAVDFRNGRSSYKYAYGYKYLRYGYTYGEKAETAAK
jgi:succinoglycan biosynthesis transport protein ExoP